MPSCNIEPPQLEIKSNEITGVLYEIASFTANANEAYMLDVRVPHNVEPLNGNKIRKAFALRTRHYEYSEVYEMLKETGNL